MKTKDQQILEEKYQQILEAETSTTPTQQPTQQTPSTPPAPQQQTSAVPSQTTSSQNNSDNQKHLNYFVSTAQFFNSDPRSKQPQEIQKTAQQLHTILTQTKSEPLKARLKPFLDFVHKSLGNLNPASGMRGPNPAANFVAQKITAELPELIKILKQPQ